MYKISVYFITAFVSIAAISQSSEESTTWLKAQKYAQQANDAFERAHRFRMKIFPRRINYSKIIQIPCTGKQR